MQLDFKARNRVRDWRRRMSGAVFDESALRELLEKAKPYAGTIT
jgi:hypothetical protein